MTTTRRAREFWSWRSVGLRATDAKKIEGRTGTPTSERQKAVTTLAGGGDKVQHGAGGVQFSTRRPGSSSPRWRRATGTTAAGGAVGSWRFAEGVTAGTSTAGRPARKRSGGRRGGRATAGTDEALEGGASTRSGNVGTDSGGALEKP